MFPGVFLQSRCELSPEGRIDVTRRINAKAINAKFAYPVLVDIDHAADNVRVFCEYIIKTGEITKIKSFTLINDFAAVVVINWLIEPAGFLQGLLCIIDERRIGV